MFKIKKTQRALFQNNLLRWYAKNARDLPWRRTRDPYKIWISEIMLQQTTVQTVIPYYEKWIKMFPVIQRVASAPLSRVLKAWQGLGYYQRARNIQKTAKIICSQYGAKIPSTREDLKKLPGFGPYTSASVLSIAFDQRVPLIDANVRRVGMRLMALQGYVETKKDKDIFEFLENVLPDKNLRFFNQALMELGALVCRSAEPLCLLCPVKSFCLVHKKGLQDIIPILRPRAIEKIEAVCAIIESNNRYFIQKRPPQGLLADLWEFPGGKIEKKETPKQALGRELKEEIGARLIAAKHWTNIKHSYTKFQVRLFVWNCRVEPKPIADKNHKWVKLGELEKYPMPSATARIVEKMTQVAPF